MGAPLSCSIHCPKAHLLIPSYERLVFQHRNFEGTLTFSPSQLSWKVMSRRLIGLSMCTVPDVLMPRFGQIHAYVSVAAGTEPAPISMVVSPPRQPEAPRQEQQARVPWVQTHPSASLPYSDHCLSLLGRKDCILPPSLP